MRITNKIVVAEMQILLSFQLTEDDFVFIPRIFIILLMYTWMRSSFLSAWRTLRRFNKRGGIMN